jgi:L-fuconolactonase
MPMSPEQSNQTSQSQASPIVPTVDAHQHYWQLARFAYGWNRQINLPEMLRDYMPPDILPQMQACGIQYSVVIQADNSVAETRWLLELARDYPHIAGVVGWVDLAAADAGETLDHLAGYPLFKGIRLMPLPQDEAGWQSLGGGLRALAARNFTCDLLPDEATLPAAIEAMRTHPETRFVINHFAGLPLTPGGIASWTAQMRPLAALPNVFLKCSAIQGLADPPPITAATLRPYLDSVLALFGAERLLFGSDWPVSTLSGPYAECIQVMREVTAALSDDEQAWLWGKTAAMTYRLRLQR